MTLLKLLKQWDSRVDWGAIDLETGYFFEEWCVHDDDALLDVIRYSDLPRCNVLSVEEDGGPYIAEAIRWGDIVDAYQRLLGSYDADTYLLRIPHCDVMMGHPKKIEAESLDLIQQYIKKNLAQRNLTKEEWIKRDEVRELAETVGYDKAISVLKKIVEK